MEMDCRQVQHYLDDLLITGPTEAEPPEVEAHIRVCPSCAQQYELARETLASIRLSHKVQTSPNLKEQIMNAVAEIDAQAKRPREVPYRRAFQWRPLAMAAVAASLLAVAGLYHWFSPQGSGPTITAFGLLTRAAVAEEAIFNGKGIVHIVNEIVVKAVTNPELAQMRWLPVVSLEATGKLRFHQLRLPVKPGEEVTIADQAWYDPATRQFVRILMEADQLVFANSYDGDQVYSVEAGTTGALRIAGTPRSTDFRSPRSPAEFLGIAAGLPSALNEQDQSLVSSVGQTTLADGSPGRVVKVDFPRGGPEASNNTYLLFTIRTANDTIAEMEWCAEGESLLVIRRLKTETVEKPGVPWNLAGIEVPAGEPNRPSKVGIAPDMVVQDISIKRMIEKADFETYMFSSDPSWAGQRQITDILDLPSPPHRMFAITYRANDKRHVVLVQSYSYNKMLGPLVKTGKLVYESPKGFKVWSGPKDQWLAEILIQSARATIKDPPSKDCIGYALESPAGTFPCLAVNGPLSDSELHGLVDSLVPAKEYRGK